MGPHDGHPDAGGLDSNCVILPDFVGLVYQLHFLLVVAVVIQAAVVGEDIESVLKWEYVFGHGLALQHFLCLFFELFHGLVASPTGRLVGGHYHSLDGGFQVQRGDAH